MVAVAHRDVETGGDGIVLDLRFSDDHEERLVLATGPDSLAVTFEGGSITFGPGTRTSQADDGPPLAEVRPS